MRISDISWIMTSYIGGVLSEMIILNKYLFVFSCGDEMAEKIRLWCKENDIELANKYCIWIPFYEHMKQIQDAFSDILVDIRVKIVCNQISLDIEDDDKVREFIITFK